MNTPTPTPRTDAATYSADCLGKTLVTNRDCPRALERELTTLTAERDQLRDQLAAAQQREAIAIASWDEERNRALREGARVVEWRDRAERAEAAETVALANWNGALERALKAEADLAAAKERLRSEAMDDYASIKDLQRELAIERARLNWLETPSGMDWQWEPERLTVSRASIDAAMKEDAK